jgi:Asp-tRNA(Asn)/Glu-tRNA(Gln) amidotransferase A subunit family amidase
MESEGAVGVRVARRASVDVRYEGWALPGWRAGCEALRAAGVDGPIARIVSDAAIPLDATAGYEPGEHHWLPRPAQSFTDAVTRPPGRLPIHLAVRGPFGVPVDDEPMAAARRAADTLTNLGHDVRCTLQIGTTRSSPPPGQRSQPPRCATSSACSSDYTAGRPTLAQLDPATHQWLIDRRPVDAVDYLEAHEQLRAFSRSSLRTWLIDAC